MKRMELFFVTQTQYLMRKLSTPFTPYEVHETLPYI